MLLLVHSVATYSPRTALYCTTHASPACLSHTPTHTQEPDSAVFPTLQQLCGKLRQRLGQLGSAIVSCLEVTLRVSWLCE